MFGLSPDELVASKLKAISKAYNEAAGPWPFEGCDDDPLALPLDEYCDYWEAALATKDAGTRAFRETIEALQKVRKTSKAMVKRGVDTDAAALAMVHGMWFMSLLIPHDYRKLKRPFALWEKAKDKDKDAPSTPAPAAGADANTSANADPDFVHTPFGPLTEFPRLFITSPPNEKPLLQLVVMVASPGIVQRMSHAYPELATAQVPRRVLRTPSDFPFVWSYVQSMITDGGMLELVLQACVSILRRVPDHLKVRCLCVWPWPWLCVAVWRRAFAVDVAVLRVVECACAYRQSVWHTHLSSPRRLVPLQSLREVTLSTVIATLVMLMECLALHPCPDPQYLLAALPVIRRMEAWPMPIGGLAAAVGDAVLHEVTAPGANVTRRLFQEQPLLTPAGQAYRAADAMRAHAWANSQHAALVLHDALDDRAVLFSSALDAPGANPFAEDRGCEEETEVCGCVAGAGAGAGAGAVCMCVCVFVGVGVGVFVLRDIG